LLKLSLVNLINNYCLRNIMELFLKQSKQILITAALLLFIVPVIAQVKRPTTAPAKRPQSDQQKEFFRLVARAGVKFIYPDGFREMLKYVMFFDTIGLSMAAVAIFLLRKKTKALDTTGIYIIKWFPLVPLIFIISYWFVTINIFITFRENPYAALICLAAYLLGLIIYYASTYKQKPQIP